MASSIVALFMYLELSIPTSSFGIRCGSYRETCCALKHTRSTYTINNARRAHLLLIMCTCLVVSCRLYVPTRYERTEGLQALVGPVL